MLWMTSLTCTTYTLYFFTSNYDNSPDLLENSWYLDELQLFITLKNILQQEERIFMSEISIEKSILLIKKRISLLTKRSNVWQIFLWSRLCAVTPLILNLRRLINALLIFLESKNPRKRLWKLVRFFWTCDVILYPKLISFP
jgi:hypothetical protein